MEKLQFTPHHLTEPPATGLAVRTTLQHFAIITYLVEPEALRPHVAPRFELDCLTLDNGTTKALVSVVPFLDVDFRFVRFPWKTWAFGQTNYRAYVRDMETGEHSVWFLGTTLDSWTVNVPRYLWKLPWHRGKIQFEIDYDVQVQRYRTYKMKTPDGWAAAVVEIEDSGESITQLAGFPDLETGLVLLTHPLRGYYYRRDGSLGSYQIWHDRLTLTKGVLREAHFQLLDRLGLVRAGQPDAVHSVLVQPRTEFMIYLPPIRL